MDYLGAEPRVPENLDIFALVQAAKYLGVPPWDLAEHTWWADQAHMCMSVEHHVKEALKNR